MTDRKECSSLLGIDLGTSSVKVLLRHSDGRIEKAKAVYTEESPEAWWEAVKTALRQIDCSAVSAIGLSSQTGTYLVSDETGKTTVIGWRDASGREELKEVRKGYDREVFLREIAMPQAPMVSYPIPRFRYIKKHFGTVRQICQPKDFIVSCLTGKRVTDYYTWRGLANPYTGQYSSYFLSETGIDRSALPPVFSPTDRAGCVTCEAMLMTGLPARTPVYLGMNDFFASIVGMGIVHDGMFDITGTSEHLGVVSGRLSEDTPLVSGPYFDRYVQYGVTASSGASLDFMGTSLGDLPQSSDDPADFLKHRPPIFLPYLSGERAPIFDGEAKGVFFGIIRGCTREDMAYAVCEGVAFSLYHIYETMGTPSDAERVTVSGGASRLVLLNRIKAELFGKTFVSLRENDTSALGAAMVAGIGHGVFRSYADAAEHCCAAAEEYRPNGTCRETLLQRYELYKKLYPTLKTEMHAFGSLGARE